MTPDELEKDVSGGRAVERVVLPTTVANVDSLLGSIEPDEVDMPATDDNELELDELTMVALPTRLALTEVASASLAADRKARTLSTELVAVKTPVVISGTVPARLIVGVLVRPCALLRAVLAAPVLIAGMTDDSELVAVGTCPDGTW